MASVTPFRGVRYNPQKVPDPSAVLAPPYDIIPPEQKDLLYERHPANIVKIDFGKDHPGDDEAENRYTRAASLLAAWMDEGLLIRDAKPAYYGYEVAYEMDGRPLFFRGLMARVRIEPYEAGVVLPHEETHSKPKADRLNLLRATRANVSPIFSLYSSPRKVTTGILAALAASGVRPLIEGTDGLGGTHRLWRIDSAEDQEAITEEFGGLRIFIADGHHRYETALAYSREAGDEAAGRVLMFLANMEEPGLTVLPTHRLLPEAPSDYLERLAARTRMEPVAMAPDRLDFLKTLAASPGHAFGLYSGEGKGYLLRVDEDAYAAVPGPLGRLDVTLLHRYLFEELLGTSAFHYEMDPAEAMRQVDAGKMAAAFFLNPTRLSELRDVALDGKRMPPKSTYFYPKLMTGMVLNLLDD